jgi:hypothetical protein
MPSEGLRQEAHRRQAAQRTGWWPAARAEGGRAFGVRQPLGPVEEVVVAVWVDTSAACAVTGLSVDPACTLLFAWLARFPIRANSAACSLDCSRKAVSACVAPQSRPMRR